MPLAVLFQIQIRLCALLVFAISMVCVSIVHADDPDHMVRFTCDSIEDYLLIEEYLEQWPILAPYPRLTQPDDTIISMRGLMWTTESSDGTFTWNWKTIDRTCRLSKNTYVATLGAELCGSPVLSLTLYRNGRLVTKELVFDNACTASPNRIKKIRFEPKTNLAFITVFNTGTYSHKELRISTETPISRERLFGLE